MIATAGPTDRLAIPIRGWFGEADPDFRREFVALGRSKFFIPAGSTIYNAGEAGPAVFGIVSGIVMVQCRFVHPDAVMLHMLRAGDWVGTVPVLFNRPRRVTAVARTGVEVLVFPVTSCGFSWVADRSGRSSWPGTLSFHIDVAVQGAADLLIRDPAARCAAVLLRLGGQRWAASHGANLPSETPAPQSELAMLCNVSKGIPSAASSAGTLLDAS